MTVLTARFADPTGYGRMVRDRNGRVSRIVEQADASEGEAAIEEVNTSIYVLKRSVVAPALRRLSPDNVQGEYYLTDIVGVLHDAGYAIASLEVDDAGDVAGVNDRVQLSRVEAELRRRINLGWLQRGVTMLDPVQTYLDTTVELAPDVTLYPGTLLQGRTTVAAGAEIGPNTQLADCTVGERAVVSASVGRSASVGADARIGPWAYLPPGTTVPAGTVTGPGFTGDGAGRLGSGAPPTPRRAEMELVPKRKMHLLSGRSHPDLAEASPAISACPSVTPTSSTSPTARSGPGSPSRSGAPTCSSSSPTAARRDVRSTTRCSSSG